MPQQGHNRPPRTVELDKELYEFAVDNCTVNLRMGLSALDAMNQSDTLSRETGEKLVQLIENFKRLKEALERARSDN